MGKATNAPVTWVDEEHGFRVMPKDDALHAAMTLEEICEQPEAVWNEDAQRFELAED